MTSTILASGGAGLIKPELGLSLWTLITFLIVLFILKRYAFGRIASLLDERREAVKQLFAKLKTKYEDTHAELVLEILKRQVVDDSTGTPKPQPRWIKYGSRVLLSLIEQSAADRDAIMDGIFSRSRDELVQAAATSAQWAKALRAHDYVYDVFAESEGAVA